MIQALHHIGLSVLNIAQASDFLQSAFSFVALPDFALTSEISATRFLRTPNCYLELQQPPTRSPGNPSERQVNEAGITHFCVQSQRMEILHAHCAGAGARFHSDPVDLGTGWLYCYARDPEANVIELEASPLAPLEQSPWLAHVAIATPNIERLATFYHQVLGGSRLGGQKLGPNPCFDQITRLKNVELIPTWIVGANLTLELWQFLTPPTSAPIQPRSFDELGYNHLCFEVAEIGATLAVCLAAGATDATSIREDKGIASVYLRDPDGNILELIEFAAPQANLSIDHLPDHDIVKRIANRRLLP